MTRVVVTGLGLITPLGNDVETSWKALCAGRSGVEPITSYDTGPFRVKFGGEIKGFDPTQYMDRKEARRNDSYEQIALAATKQALAQAKLEITNDIADDVGVYIGSGIGGLE